jgi:hypothetical protein
MAEEGMWDAIRERGLLSTSALLDLYKIDGDDRVVIESQHRPESVVLNHPVYGPAIVRDQKPMRETSLRKCLINMTPREWYEFLNGRAFFWMTKERLLRLLAARAYRDRVHCVLTIDTHRLLSVHSERIRLSPINSGSTIYRPKARGRDTFLSLRDYPFDERKRARGVRNAIAEMCVDYSVPDIADFVVRVAHMRGSEEIEILHEALV